VITRIYELITRIWYRHRAMAIAVPVIALVAIVVASLLLVGGGGGGSAQASATPGATSSATTSALASLVPNESPTPTEGESPTPTISPTPTLNPTPTPLPAGMAYADLDGVLTTTALAHRLPMAFMIDNQTSASRPQSGMSTASIVIQAPNDLSSDRYQMYFQEGTAVGIGPVRSTRPYYVKWADEYKALLGHYGGDALVLQVTIPANKGLFYNLDGLRGGSCAYHRIKTRVIPHNVYTSTAAAIKCATKLGYPATYQNMPTRPFRADTPAAQLPAQQVFTIKYPTETIGYTFDPATDSYLRSESYKVTSSSGKVGIISGPELDKATGKDVYARNVIVMYQAIGVQWYEPHDARRTVGSIGSGKAVVFQEGKEIIGTWSKPTDTALTRFYDSTGKEIPLVRGEIFIQSIPSSYPLTIIK
jgi:hypothetical protein